MRYFLFPVSRIKSLCYTEAFIAPASSEAGATGGRSPIPIPNTLLETPWTNYVPPNKIFRYVPCRTVTSSILCRDNYGASIWC